MVAKVLKLVLLLNALIFYRASAIQPIPQEEFLKRSPCYELELKTEAAGSTQRYHVWREGDQVRVDQMFPNGTLMFSTYFRLSSGIQWEYAPSMSKVFPAIPYRWLAFWRAVEAKGLQNVMHEHHISSLWMPYLKTYYSKQAMLRLANSFKKSYLRRWYVPNYLSPQAFQKLGNPIRHELVQGLPCEVFQGDTSVKNGEVFKDTIWVEPKTRVVIKDMSRIEWHGRNWQPPQRTVSTLMTLHFPQHLPQKVFKYPPRTVAVVFDYLFPGNRPAKVGDLPPGVTRVIKTTDFGIDFHRLPSVGWKFWR